MWNWNNPKFGNNGGFDHQGGGHGDPYGDDGNPTHTYGPPTKGGGGNGPGRYFMGWESSTFDPRWRPHPFGGGGNGPNNDHGPSFNKGGKPLGMGGWTFGGGNGNQASVNFGQGGGIGQGNMNWNGILNRLQDNPQLMNLLNRLFGG